MTVDKETYLKLKEELEQDGVLVKYSYACGNEYHIYFVNNYKAAVECYGDNIQKQAVEMWNKTDK